MELTTLELGYWYQYLVQEQEDAKATMRSQKHGVNTAKHRRSR